MQVIAKFRILLILALLLFSVGQISAQGPPNYRYVQLKHFDTTFYYNGGDAEINELNQVAFRGAYLNRLGSYVNFSSQFPGTIWTNGVVDTLLHGAANQSYAGWNRINNLAQVPGQASSAEGANHLHAFIASTRSSISELGLLPKTHVPDPTFGPCVYARATDISDNGLMVGVAYEGDNFYQNKHAYPVIYQGSVATKIPHPDGLPDSLTDYVFPIYVNNNGQIAGTETSGDAQAFFGNQNGLSFIPLASDSVQQSEINDINDNGYAVGMLRGNLINPYTGLLAANQRHSFVSIEGGQMFDLHDLDSVGWVGWSNAYDINNDNHIVGGSSSSTALLWWYENSDWTLYNLRSLVTEGENIPTNINGAVSINDRGVILGYVSLGGLLAPCLLIPTDLDSEICVNSAADDPDVSPGDGVCSTGDTDALGEDICTMRAAIMEANARSGLDTICFRIPYNEVIYPQSELPDVTDSVFINGLSQPGHMYVHLNGSQQGSGRGLELTSGYSTVRGLMLNEFTTAGMVLISGDSNVVENCWFGTDDEMSDLGNGEYGIYIENSSGNRIGTPGALERANSFSYNGTAGVFVASGEQNRIFTNMFMFNDGLAIDLAPSGVNENDDDDADVGPNTLLNYPIIDSIAGGILYGTYDGEPNETITIELYRSDSADATGSGEGEEPLLLTTNVNTDANGVGTISLALSGETLSPGQVFTLLAHDNDNTSEFSPAWPNKSIRVVDYLENPIADKEFVMYRVDGGGPDFPETFIDTIMTDSEGKLNLTEYFETSVLAVGSVIKLHRMMDSLATVRDTGSISFMPNAIEWHLDNAKFDSTTYTMGYDTLDGINAEQTIVMNHTLVLLNMVVSIEWEVEDSYVDDLETGLRSASNYLFDITDGQMALGKIFITDDKFDWERADLQIYAKNTYSAEAWKNGVRTVGDLHMKTGRQWFGDESYGPDSSYFLPLNPGAYKNFAAIIHEAGHYYMNLGDEYIFKSPDERCHPDTRYGFMDNYYELDNALSSEMSQVSNYMFNNCDNTVHYVESGNKSCWEVFDELFTNTANDIPLPIFKPTERNLASGASNQYIGPNDNLASPDYDIGARMEVERSILANSSSTRTIVTYDVTTMLPARYSEVELVKVVKGFDKRYQDQGRASIVGGIRVLGAEDGDSLRISGVPQVFITKNNSTARSVADYAWLSTKVELTSADSVDVNASAVDGSFPALCDATLDSNAVTLLITPENVFSEDPFVTIYTDSGVTSPQALPISSGVYQSVLTDTLLHSGQFEITALDASSDTFFFPIEYMMYEIADTLAPHDIFSNGQDLSLSVDSSHGVYHRVMVMSTQYPIMPGMLPAVSKQVSRAHSLSVYPNTDFNADGRLTISYSDALLNNDTTLYENELSIHIHKWNDVSFTWDRLSTEVDTSFGKATASISGPGIYTAFTTDVNTDVIISNTNVLPNSFALSQNYPNPFNPETKIDFALPTKSDVTLIIHNVLGQKVKTLVETELSAGQHSVFWDGTDDSGHKVASGVYLYRFNAGDFVETKKMVLLK